MTASSVRGHGSAAPSPSTRARVGANAVVTKDVPEGAVMVGIPARSTLLDANEYAREFVPYGTSCSENFDPATQKVELLQCQLDLMQKQLKALLDERELAAVDDEAPRRKGSRRSEERSVGKEGVRPGGPRGYP